MLIYQNIIVLMLMTTTLCYASSLYGASDLTGDDEESGSGRDQECAAGGTRRTNELSETAVQAIPAGTRLVRSVGQKYQRSLAEHSGRVRMVNYSVCNCRFLRTVHYMYAIWQKF